MPAPSRCLSNARGGRGPDAALKIPPLHWFRTVFFLIPAISVYTIVLGTLSILSTFVDRKGHAAHWCARAWSWLILATTGVDVRVSGLDRVRAGETYVFISNHQSIYDIPVIFASLPFQLRIIAKESLGRFPFLGWHLIRAGHLLVDRRNPDRSGILNRWRRLVRDRLSGRVAQVVHALHEIGPVGSQLDRRGHPGLRSQALSAARTSSSIFFASPKSIRLLSL